jgi:hypothetical protein
VKSQFRTIDPYSYYAITNKTLIFLADFLEMGLESGVTKSIPGQSYCQGDEKLGVSTPSRVDKHLIFYLFKVRVSVVDLFPGHILTSHVVEYFFCVANSYYVLGPIHAKSVFLLS